jgi:hypothetical protein
MEKIIFLSLALSILGFILYLGVSAILKGFKAKNNKNLENTTNDEDTTNNLNVVSDNLSEELVKLNELFKTKVLTQEEFEKAKKKLIEN